MAEVYEVMNYVKNLLNVEISGRKVVQSDIGIVVPYKLQFKVIKRLCTKLNLDDITIGIAEVFQGQEKPIMIVTTLRTDGKLGFLKDSRVRILYIVLMYC